MRPPKNRPPTHRKQTRRQSTRPQLQSQPLRPGTALPPGRVPCMITLIPESNFARSPAPEGRKLQQLSKPGAQLPRFVYRGIISLGLTNQLIIVILRLAVIHIADCPTMIALPRGTSVRRRFISFNQPYQKKVGDQNVRKEQFPGY